MQRTSTPCPDCDGEGGYTVDDEKPVKTTYDYKHGETYRTNWVICPLCGGDGEIDNDGEEE